MLARKQQLTRTSRTPPVHERIALQCARNISQLAAALPKPRTPTGHLPVLVELRCPEENVVYRYQVNLPPSSVDKHRKQMSADEARALSQQLKLPCLVHGRAQEHDSQSQSQSQALLPQTQDNEPPQLVMMQDAVHVVTKRPVQSQHMHSKETIATFHYSAFASGAEKITRDHFMAALHEQQASPLKFHELWPDQQNGHLNDEEPPLQLVNVQQQQATALPKQAASGQLLGKTNHAAKLQLQPVKSKQQAAPNRRHIKQQTANTLPKYSKNEALSLKAYNTHKQPRKPLRTATQCSNHIVGRNMNSNRRFGSSLQQILPGPVNVPHVNQQQQFPRQDSINNFAEQQQEPTKRFCLPHVHPRQHSLREVQPFFLPRIDNFGNFFDLQRELQLRRKLEQELQQQKFFEQQKYQGMFTETQNNFQVPTELQSLFSWDCCHLCQTAMRTMRNSVDHYLSKTHLRRVDSWLIRYSFVEGHLSDDMLRHLRSSGPAVLHCELCDLKLTSVIHARQHVYGRRHRLVERHISKPNGEGYYDKTGRWVRTNDKWLMCQLCDIIVTSESQLIIHMAGLRHRKRERSNGSTTIAESYNGSYVYRINANGSLVPLNPDSGFYIYAGRGKQTVRKLHDLNAVFYCEVCNITLNHLKSVKQHEEGRLHRKKLERALQKK